MVVLTKASTFVVYHVLDNLNAINVKSLKLGCVKQNYIPISKQI